jgi:hypothetical protein
MTKSNELNTRLCSHDRAFAVKLGVCASREGVNSHKISKASSLQGLCYADTSCVDRIDMLTRHDVVRGNWFDDPILSDRFVQYRSEDSSVPPVLQSR